MRSILRYCDSDLDLFELENFLKELKIFRVYVFSFYVYVFGLYF